MRIFSVLAILIMGVTLCAFSIGHVNYTGNNNKLSIEDSLEKDRMKFLNEVMASIKGSKKLPADSVFRNLKVIKGQSSVSAEHLLWMMNWGWSKELEVSCFQLPHYRQMGIRFPSSERYSQRNVDDAGKDQ